MNANDTIHSVTSATSDRAMSFADRALDKLGFVRKSGPLESLLMIGAGLVIGGTAVAFLTPVSGAGLRRKVRQFFTRTVDAVEETEARLEARGKKALAGAAEKIDELTHATKGKLAEEARANGTVR